MRKSFKVAFGVAARDLRTATRLALRGDLALDEAHARRVCSHGDDCESSFKHGIAKARRVALRQLVDEALRAQALRAQGDDDLGLMATDVREPEWAEAAGKVLAGLATRIHLRKNQAAALCGRRISWEVA